MHHSLTGFARMTWLALAAVLLIAVAPTVSRVLAVSATGDAPTWVELCTAGGLKVIDIASFAGDREAPPPAQHTMDEACGYCVLVTSLPVVLLLLCALLLPPALATPLRRYTLALRRVRNCRGLGSQAPPSAL